MPLKDAFNPNKPPNIKDVQYTPEKKHEKIFDPERDIAEEDWQGMVGELENWRSSHTDTYWGIYEQAAVIAIISPKRKSELTIKEKNFLLDWIKNSRQPDPETNRTSFFERASLLPVLLPERTAELDLTDDDFCEILNTVEWHRKQKNWWGFSFSVLELLTLFPERKAELRLTDEDFQGMLDEIEKERQDENWEIFCGKASHFRILFQTRKAELKLTEQDFRGMLDQLETTRKNKNWWSFAHIVANLKILLADEIKRKEDGTLEIIFNKPKVTELKEETPPLPVTRNY